MNRGIFHQVKAARVSSSIALLNLPATASVLVTVGPRLEDAYENIVSLIYKLLQYGEPGA